MAHKIMTIQWLPVFAVAAPVPLLWLMVVASPVSVALAMIALIVASSIVAGALRIGWSRNLRSMAEVIHDVDAEAPPISVRAMSAVSTPRRDLRRS